MIQDLLLVRELLLRYFRVELEVTMQVSIKKAGFCVVRVGECLSRGPKILSAPIVSVKARWCVLPVFSQPSITTFTSILAMMG